MIKDTFCFLSYKKSQLIELAFLVLSFLMLINEMTVCYKLEIFGEIVAACSHEEDPMAFNKQKRKFRRKFQLPKSHLHDLTKSRFLTYS